MIIHMKQVLVQLDDRLAAQLEKLAPGRSRRRSEFIRAAIQRAIWQLQEEATARAYREQPEDDKVSWPEPAWEPPARPAKHRTRR